MGFGRGSTPRYRKTRSGLDLSTSAGRHRGALTVVEPTISVPVRVEALHARRDYRDVAEATSVGISPSAGPRAARRRIGQARSREVRRERLPGADRHAIGIDHRTPAVLGDDV